MYARNETIDGLTIYLDGATLKDCKVKNCKLVIAGLMPFSLDGCNFENCSWAFTGPAAQTIEILKLLYASGAQKIVDGVISAIQQGKSVKQYLH